MGKNNKDIAESERMENKNIEIAVNEVGEDATQYGEFISTYFAWIPLNKQKQKAEQMEEMTKKNTKKQHEN